MPRFNTSDGLSLHYDDDGAGLPVLCLSGLTRDGRDFDYVAPHLTDVRLIRMDYRGRGRSDFGDWRDYTLQREGTDALELLDHLGIEKAAILGTSRGGLIAMGLAATVPQRLLGVALNDIGPELDPKGLTNIMGYLGRAPVWKTYEEAAKHRPHVMPGFANVPPERWRAEVEKFYVETPTGLTITYDPHLRDAVEQAGATAVPDLWPFFDALKPLPTAALRGANSDLLSADTFAKMQDRHPAMHAATVADRGHVPFLDEPESLETLHAWIGAMR
ncbi:alpha/beta fold hydrolase [Pseudaestuariivita atlantica]|uniref:Hydrolase n=1 Tax=Pseudaestuariivita atlantica TaxID=1317121 RepID=A0A0L1JLJ9_9RHOB|nr:alpha/beta hydrolase [Pseudaestuariivita atlantica]KNG92625.1 hydrolase [Pseudaestuariivita atlantica]